MKVLSRIIIIMLATSVLYAADSHSEKTTHTKNMLKGKRGAILKETVDLEIALKAHDLTSKNIAKVRDILTKMNKDLAWANLVSRTTKTSKTAQVTLEQYLKDANNALRGAFRQLELVKIAEYETWSRTHPAEARVFKLEERVKLAQLDLLDAALKAYKKEGTAGNNPGNNKKWAVDHHGVPGGKFKTRGSTR